MINRIFKVKLIEFNDRDCRLFLNNKEGSINGLADLTIAGNIRKNDIVKVTAEVIDERRLKIIELQKLSNVNYETAINVYSAVWAYQEKYDEFINILLGINDLYCRYIIRNLFLSHSIINRFFYIGASINPNNHHFRKFGLFLHTYEVMKYGLFDIEMLNLTAEDRDIFITASLFHDIGKCLDDVMLINGHKQASLNILNYCAARIKDRLIVMRIINAILHTHSYDYDFKKSHIGIILKNADIRSAQYNKTMVKASNY